MAGPWQNFEKKALKTRCFAISKNRELALGVLRFQKIPPPLKTSQGGNPPSGTTPAVYLCCGMQDSKFIQGSFVKISLENFTK